MSEDMKESLPQREAYWEEMDDKTKIELLARTLETAWSRLARMEDEMERMRNHKHHEGELLVPYRMNGISVGYAINPLKRQQSWKLSHYD